MYSLCDVPAQGGWRAIANWTLPPSDRIGYRIVSVKSSRSYTRTTVGRPIFMRLSDVVFLVNHRDFKTLEVGVCTLCHAIRCLFEYMDISEAPIFEIFSFIIMEVRFYILLYLMFH